MKSYSKLDIRVERVRDPWDKKVLDWTCEVWVRSFLGDTEVLLSSEDRVIEEMRVWTLEQGGERTAWNRFSFPSEEGATMFVLRWSAA
jgi:hypothetical protein